MAFIYFCCFKQHVDSGCTTDWISFHHEGSNGKHTFETLDTLVIFWNSINPSHFVVWLECDRKFWKIFHRQMCIHCKREIVIESGAGLQFANHFFLRCSAGLHWSFITPDIDNKISLSRNIDLQSKRRIS